MDFNIKVYINRHGDKLTAKFTPEDMKYVYASRLTLRELAQYVVPFGEERCTIYHDRITWTSKPGDWDDMDVEDVEKELEDMLLMC
jgi:hypothetical protein